MADDHIEEFGLFEQACKSPKKELLPRLDQVFRQDNSSFAPRVYNDAPISNINLDKNSSSQVQPSSTKACSPSTSEEGLIDINKEIDFLTAKTEIKESKTVSKDLSKRPDVVNKTILRSMKRFYFTEFETFSGFSAMPDSQRFAKFHQLIREYILSEFKSLSDLSEQELNDTIFFFGSMISHIHMRRGIKVSKQRTQVNFVHKCLYNYSHKKLAQLMTQGGFKHVLRDFVNFGGIDVVIKGEETLAKNQDVYKTSAEELLLKTQE
jgi:hypothetical protein